MDLVGVGVQKNASSDGKKIQKSIIRIFSDLEKYIIFEISAEFYPILMYHMSKSDENWPSCKKLSLES